MKLRILRKTTKSANERGYFFVSEDRLQMLVPFEQDNGPMVAPSSGMRWEDVPIVDATRERDG